MFLRNWKRHITWWLRENTSFSDYLNRQALKVGYLLIFDHANTKTWTSEWIDWQDKKIFVVWV
jgi:hypothetical protein